MLSIGRIGAGEGYQYLTRQVASQDAGRQGERLIAYYERHGYPAGQWLGRQAEAFGLSGAVTEEPMQALFGQCCDPRTGEQLGRRLAVFRTVEERISDRLGALDHEPSDEERALVEAEEVAKGTSQAVTGFDLTFSAPKSVSVLFALGDDDTRDMVRAAHADAWREAFGHFEDDVAATRLGSGGVAQVDARGVSAAAFEHWYSRAGDPQLHTHVAVSSIVQTHDGRWRRIDSRALYRASASVGERYTAALMRNLSDRAGVGWRHRSQGRSGTPLPEIAGVSDELVRAFSSRSQAIDDSLLALVREYQERHGYAPPRAVVARLAQQATLSDRPAGEHRSLVESSETWRQEAAEVLGCRPEQVTGRLADAVAGAASERPLRPVDDSEDLAPVVAATFARLTEKGATWSERDMRRAVTAQLREDGRRIDGPTIERALVAVLGDPESVPVAGLEPEPTPDTLRRSDGSSPFIRRGESRYTSRAVLAAEAGLVALATTRQMAPDEQAARAAGPLGEVEDDALVRIAGAARGHLERLGQRLDGARREVVDGEEQLAALAGRLDEIGTGPRLRLVEDELERTEQAAARLVEAEAQLSRRILPRSQRAEAEELRAQLRRDHPDATLSAPTRARRADEARNRARRKDRAEVQSLTEHRDQLASAVARSRSRVEMLGAEIAEQTSAVEAVETELRRRQHTPGRVDMSGRLDGLGVDQAAAMVRLADPSRPVDALVGPAGSGKTRALAALAAAFRDDGRQVHCLAPTAVAAEQLGSALDVQGETLHRAAGRWEQGYDLPGRGDLVLIDEASMATTPMLLRVCELATGQGAMVRLIGDPRQLKAVGAGGGLSLVADAVEAPELVELRRFHHGWEADATLALRRGDSSALDVYETHDRITGATDAAAVGAVFSAWWDSPAGRDRTLMVASDTATVRQLSTLARAELVAAGEVDEAGVALSDGTTAGRGDIISTRQNRRDIAPRRDSTAHVRNRDRWAVDEVHRDGSLTVSHLDRGHKVRLPADYVAVHVELGYASTGHSVQGRTVDRAEVLVRPSDTRWYLYVAASRAQDETHLHVVTEELEEEPHGFSAQRPPRAVLEQVLDRDEPVAASEWVAAGQAAVRDPQAMADRFRAGRAEELRARLGRILAAHGGGLDQLAAEDGWRVMAAADAFEAAGGDAGAIVADVGAGTPGQLVEALDRARFTMGGRERLPLLAGVLPAPGPQVAPDVAAWQLDLAGKLAAWRRDLAARLADGTAPPPQWAARLGPLPQDETTRAEWAARVAHVATYRTAWRVESGLLGPRPSSDSAQAVARASAARAAQQAQLLASEIEEGELPRLEGQVLTSPPPDIEPPEPGAGPRLGP